MSEGLRIALTPDVPHLAAIADVAMLTVLAAMLTFAGVRGFGKRVVV
jgi:hypothetical protein